jgi:hypothetical protein
MNMDSGRPGVRRGQADLPNLDAPHGALGDTAATGPSPC